MAQPEAAPAGVHVIVPVKNLSGAKTRLSGALTPHARRRLALAMFDDTVAAVASSAAVAAVWVVTPDPAVAAHAADLGARVLDDEGAPRSGTSRAGFNGSRRTVGPGLSPLNAAVTAAVAAVRSRCASKSIDLAIVHADLPALRSAELTGALSEALGRGRGDASGYGDERARGHCRRWFVADRAGTGTTALISSGGAEPAPMFGPGSARDHRVSGAAPLRDAGPGLRSDVDTLTGLEHARRLGLGPATSAVLAELGPAVQRAPTSPAAPR